MEMNNKISSKSVVVFLGGIILNASLIWGQDTAPASQTASTTPDAQKSTSVTPVLDFFKTTQLSGFVDVYYGYNFNQPSDQSVGLRGLDTKSNSFQLNLLKLTFNKPATEKNSVGYRFDLMYGPAADSYTAFEPRDGQKTILKNIQQAYISYNAPIGKGLTLDFGKYATFMGAEVLETIDNWHYQQSILFSYAQPYYHTGLRATYPVSDKFALGGYVVNGWNNSFDNNTGKSVGMSATYTPNPKFQIIQNWLGGPEHNDTNQGWRHLFDTVASINASDKVAFKFNYDYGFDGYLPPATGNAAWQGIAAAVKFTSANKKHSFAPRFEYYHDRDGFTTGTTQNIKELTLTYDLRLKPNFSTKFEYRGDYSNAPYFKKETDLFSKNQNVVMIGVVYAFGYGRD
jgi:hypothetical protein